MKKAQVAVEYLIVVSLSIAILTPLIIWAYQNLIGYKESNNLVLARNAVDKIGQAVDWVFSQGPPAKMEIEIYLPEGIEEIQIANKTILFKVKTSAGTSDIFYISLANVTGNLPRTSGYRIVKVQAFENNVTVGV
jgi:hypothetical protein